MPLYDIITRGVNYVKNLGKKLYDNSEEGSFVDRLGDVIYGEGTKSSSEGSKPIYPTVTLPAVSSPNAGGASNASEVVSLPAVSSPNAGGASNASEVVSPSAGVAPSTPYIYTPGSAAPTDGDPLSYAGWLQGSTKYQAEQDRIRAEQKAEQDRQRAIVDANSAAALGAATYGANAEKLASMGLSTSGYGEYLLGKTYATQRGEVQNANRTAQARVDQALYEEGKIKQQADAKYAEDLIGIETQKNASYGALYDSAMNGASIDSIMQDSRWATLSPEQQSVIRGATVSNSIKAALDSGKTLDEIKADAVYGWNGLTVDAQNALTTYYNGIEDKKNAENDDTYTKMLDLIAQGTPMDDLVNTSAYEKLDDTSKANLHYRDMLNQVNKGVTLTELWKSPYWKKLSWPQIMKIKNAADDYAEYKKKTVTAEVSEALGNTNILTKDQLIEDLMRDYTDMNFVNKVVQGWQEKNLETMKNEKDLTQAMIDQAVAKGRITEDQAKELNPKQVETPPSDTPSETPSEGGKKDGSDIEDPAAFIENNVKLGTATTKGGAWHMNDLRQGFEGEDVELIIGSADGETGRSFDAKIGAKEADETTVKALNKLATGSETGTPSVDYERAFNIFGANNTDSGNKPGKIVAYNGVLYIYTRRLGWARLEGETAADTAAMTAEFIKNAS